MYDFQAGEVLLVDKPLQWTSFDVVNKIKWLLKKELGFKKIKVGHAGTLDPLATGLLIVCTGKKTKTIPEIQDQAKTYTGEFELGSITPSYDLETEVEWKSDTQHLSLEDLEKAAEDLSGEFDQLPPIFSAKKIKGKRAYELARKGEKPKMKSKRIQVFQFDIREVNLPSVAFEVHCSKGTYIRSLAHDFGEKLAVGAYLKSLRRTKIGAFKVSAAESIESLSAKIKAQAAE
ncbi:MAG: tRNA pseudouridine(55) synthase TruB [Vicingaceae bacterium]